MMHYGRYIFLQYIIIICESYRLNIKVGIQMFLNLIVLCYNSCSSGNVGLHRYIKNIIPMAIRDFQDIYQS